MIKSDIFTDETGNINLLTIVNNCGAKVTVSTLGAGILAIIVPDAHGNMADVVMGYDNISDHRNDGHAAGKIVGRYANRIAGGKFSIEGKEYALAINNGPNSLHGGPTGFQNRIWDIVTAEGNTVRMRYHSADGEEGFPGNLTVEVEYRWTDDCELIIEMYAETDKATVVNLTNHTYFNLGGHDSGTALNHLLRLYASRWLTTDEFLIPDGNMADVTDTPMDFTSPRALGSVPMEGNQFSALRYGKGYDNCWIIDNHEPGQVKPNAVLHDPESGRTLTILSSQPGVQVYTGNWISSTPIGKGGYRYRDYDAVAIECQDLPDAPNRPEFPSTELRPGQRFHRTIVFKFS